MSSQPVLNAIPPILFRMLRQIDNEANSQKDGFPTGLNWYAIFHAENAPATNGKGRTDG